MSGKPALDDYFDALLGEDSPAPAAAQPAAVQHADATSAPVADAPQAPSRATADAAPPEPAAQPAPMPPMGDPLDELEAVFEQAHAEAKAAGVFNQAETSQTTPAPQAAPMGDPLDELEAVFEQAHAEAKAAGVFNQAEAAQTTPAPQAAPMGDPLDELEAVFEQAHAEAKAAGVFNQAEAAQTTPAPQAAPMGDPLDELEAVFEQAHAEAKAAGVFNQAEASPAGATGPNQNELDELEAAFEAAAEAARQARSATPVAPPPAAPTHVPLPEPASAPPQHGLLKPQLVKRSEAVKRRLARRREQEDEERKAVPVEQFHRWLRFQMGGQSYAVELLKVQEVQRVPDIMPVRGAPPQVIGVMNLRGQIIAVIDLGACIGLASEPLTEASRVIVLETEDETVGLLVSAVAEVISLSERAVENPVSSIPALPKEALIGIARHPNGMSVLLDATVFLR